MDADGFRDAVEESMATELERLGSSKRLVALTDADLSEERVLRSAADSEYTAAKTLEGWADEADHDGAREAFAEFGEQERDHYDRIADLLEGDHEFETDGIDPMHAELRSLESTAARLGGLAGRALVGDRTHLQVVSFFVNEGDESRADCFRELRTETVAQGERAAALLAEITADEGEWDEARAAAEAVIDAAYGAYADSLDELGLDPKPIC
ncbi:rubrerythrin family protein [Natrinema saccharevitans]|uniref:Rubrerythrin family protein n=1 Tax=Natrinema saccharevitans TaxID=301967 RepID=A0A1S8AYE5_9EURY|nr:rubrerythrin family protein [Natrinema saccharevitans]OLZ41873.1 rubrerythrin family protein [Natrinema saccharevitans]